MTSARHVTSVRKITDNSTIAATGGAFGAEFTKNVNFFCCKSPGRGGESPHGRNFGPHSNGTGMDTTLVAGHTNRANTASPKGELELPMVPAVACDPCAVQVKISHFAHRYCNACGCKVYITWNYSTTNWDEDCCCAD